MKQAKQFMFLLMFILCLRTEAGTSKRGADSLAFSIHLDKSEYLRGEGVWLHLFVINLTADTLQAVLPNCYGINTVKLRAVDNSGRELANTSGISNSGRIIYQQDLLLPHDTLLGIIDLTWHFDQISRTEDRYIVGQFPGRFTVDAVYLDRMTSNAVHYSVEEPKGSEAEAFSMYRSVVEAERSLKWPLMILNIEALLQRFPQSVYAPQALDMMPQAYNNKDVHDIEKIIACSKRLIVRYPNSPWCQLAFGRILIRQTLEENQTYLQSIVSNKYGTRAARIAKNLLIRPWLEKSSKNGPKRQNK